MIIIISILLIFDDNMSEIEILEDIRIEGEFKMFRFMVGVIVKILEVKDFKVVERYGSVLELIIDKIY